MRHKPFKWTDEKPTVNLTIFCFCDAAVEKNCTVVIQIYKHRINHFFLFTTVKFSTFIRFRRTCFCLQLWKVLASNCFNTHELLEMVLGDGSVEKDFDKQESERGLASCSILLQDRGFSERSVQPLPPCDRLLEGEVRAEIWCLFSFISSKKFKNHWSNIWAELNL